MPQKAVKGRKTVKAGKQIVVDQGVCIGCGSCEAICPEYFTLNSQGKSSVKKAYSEEDKDIIKEAQDNCPVGAISIIDK